MNHFTSIYTRFLFILLLTTGCKKFLAIDPPKTQLPTAVVYADDGSATATMRGVYSRMMAAYGNFASGGTSLYPGLSSDELMNYSSSSTQSEFYQNSILTTNPTLLNYWGELYRYIYSMNALLEGLAASNGVSPAVRQQLEGEARFARAFCYFYLVNTFGEVPLVRNTSYEENNTAIRNSRSELYAAIVEDLVAARSLLKNDFSAAGGERTLPNQGAATALLARVYLYLGDYPNAADMASILLDNGSVYTLLTDLNKVFLKNSPEAIWQLTPVRANENTPEATFFILTSAPTSCALTTGLVNNFEPGDQRRMNWVGSLLVAGQTYYYPQKYKIRTGLPVNEYSMILRIAEQWLIRAEARMRMDQLVTGLEDLNILRSRAGLPALSGLDKAGMLSALERERRFELFAEWGHRWFDLKRTGRADAVMQPVKGTNWTTTDTLYPIPQTEIQNNVRLTQNPGY